MSEDNQIKMGVRIAWCRHYPEGLKGSATCAECDLEREQKPGPISTVTSVKDGVIVFDVEPTPT